MNYPQKLNDLSKIITTNYDHLFLQVPNQKGKGVISKLVGSDSDNKSQTSGRRSRKNNG